jgi:uncharacterized protein (TIRG00374 family)
MLYIKPNALLEEFRKLDPSILSIAALAIVVSTFLGFVNSYLILARSGEISWGRFLPIYWVGWALSLVVPGQVGDVAGISALLKKHGLDWHTSIGRSLVDKAISFAVSCLFGLLALSQITEIKERMDFSDTTVLGSTALTVVVFVVVTIITTRSEHALARKLRDFAAKVTREFFYTVQNYPLRLLINSCLTILKIVVIGLAYFYTFKAFGYSDLDYLPVIGLAAASGIVAYIPISFNGLGTAELAGIALFSALGIAASAVLSAYLTLRFIVMLLAWIPAGGWLLMRRDSTG